MNDKQKMTPEQEANMKRMLQTKLINEKLGDIKHKIMVMSGKGGVGKSTTAANVALGLADRGYKVGILDTDLHGPSITKILGLDEKRVSVDDQKNQVIPVQYSDNLTVISIQFLLEDSDSALIWRGPIKIGVIRQFIADVNWGKLDYLIIDSPPGTGDEPLTVAQTIQGCQALIVTTPQYVSLADVRKSINFCKQVQMPILGILENMSGLVCPHCGESIDLFKKHGGKKMAEEFSLPFLGAIPIEPKIVDMGDSGKSIFEIKEETVTANEYAKTLDKIEKVIGQTVEPNTKDETASDSKPEKKEKGETMIYALPVNQGQVSSHFGHCEKFAFVEVQDKSIKNINYLTPPPHEPGVLPKWLSENKANVILTGGMGSRAKSMFDEYGIKVICGVNTPGSPEEIIAQYLSGSLALGDNACDH